MGKVREGEKHSQNNIRVIIIKERCVHAQRYARTLQNDTGTR